MTYGAWVLILTLITGQSTSIVAIDNFRDAGLCQQAAAAWAAGIGPDTNYRNARAVCVTRSDGWRKQ